MQVTIVLLVALILPHPYSRRPARPPARPKQIIERGPTWGHDPVRVAHFDTMAGALNRDAQLRAQEQGRKSYETYLAHIARGRMAIVGQIQMQLPSTPPAASAPSAPHNPNPIVARPWGW